MPRFAIMLQQRKKTSPQYPLRTICQSARHLVDTDAIRIKSLSHCPQLPLSRLTLDHCKLPESTRLGGGGGHRRRLTFAARGDKLLVDTTEAAVDVERALGQALELPD